MKRLVPFLLILSILLFSCSRSSFTLSGVSFIEDEEGCKIRAYLDNGDEDEDYSFILTSPDGDLVWKGEFSLERDRLTSESLLLTPGATMPKEQI